MMMKQQILLFLALMMLPMVACANTVEIEGIYYELISKAKQATVKGAVSTSGSVVIPASVFYEGVEYSVSSIGSEVFKGRSLTSVTIPNSVTSIGENAFQGCSGLTSVHISDIAAWCRISFGSGYANPLNCAHHLYLGDEEIKDLVIPNSVTCIERCAFWGCSGLTSVNIPSSVTSIGSSAFYGCSGLTAVHISDIGAWCKISFVQSSNPLSLARHLFLNGEEVKDLEIPNSVTSIGSSAFSGCSGLTSVTIPNSVTLIRDYSFGWCNALTSITIGSEVNTIGTQAFTNCPELTDVYCYAENVPNMKLTDYLSIFYTDAFYGSLIEYATLHVPTQSIDAYKSKEPWKNFKEIIAIDGPIPEIEQCATPTISYNNGKLTYHCETEGATCQSTITNADVNSYSGNEVQLAVTYKIRVYATKVGYENSDVATATLYWIDATPETEGVIDGIAQIAARPVLVKADNGIITIEGIEDGTNVSIYTTDGKQAGSAIIHDGIATIATSIQSGSIAIVKVGEKGVKVAM